MSSGCPVLMNTKAGALHGEAGRGQLQRMARNLGVDIEVICTQSAEDMQDELRKMVASGVDRVGVAGGDGTVRLAAQELAHTKTALGILSQGTFNNFASVLRLPHNLPEALRMLRDGIVREVDLGHVEDRYFTESAGVGLFADALALYGQGSNKNFLRGLEALVRLGLEYHAQEYTVVWDGQTISGRATAIEVCNTYRIAQAVPIAPEADVEDGMLDVVILGDIPRRELLDYGRALRAQMHLGLPHVAVLRAQSVQIMARYPHNIHADDRIVGVTPQTITVAPRALKVLVDPRL